MTHKIVKEDIRVVVDVRYRSWLSYENDPEEQIKLAEEVVTQIKRHVDRVADARVVFDCRYLCEFCGEDITNEPDRVMDSAPIECCDQQIDAWRTRHQTEKLAEVGGEQ